MDVVDGVGSGGVVMPMPRLRGLGEIEFEIGDGILYLQINQTEVIKTSFQNQFCSTLIYTSFSIRFANTN